MQELFAEILDLQKKWTHINTPEMQRRGVLVRNDVASWLRTQRDSIVSAMGVPDESFEVEGKDGTGRKTEIPWVRYCSLYHSPNARTGWYCVYLFHADGEGFYLTLNQGTTKWENGEFKPKPKQDLLDLVSWARGVLASDLVGSDIVTEISLGAKGDLGDAYETGTVAAICYPKSAIPSLEKLSSDVILFAKLLGKLYSAEDLGLSVEPVQRQAESLQEMIKAEAGSKANKGGRGQGFGLSPAERIEIERHSMAQAKNYLLQQAYDIEDVSKTHSYDFIATKDGKKVIVEVKGTTSMAKSIILTANEVAAHRKFYPENILIICHSIKLERGADAPVATGGTLDIISPWNIEENNLKPMAYQYMVG